MPISARTKADATETLRYLSRYNGEMVKLIQTYRKQAEPDGNWIRRIACKREKVRRLIHRWQELKALCAEQPDNEHNKALLKEVCDKIDDEFLNIAQLEI